MTSNIYATLDAAILQSVASGKHQFNDIQAAKPVRESVIPLIKLQPKKLAMRFVDSRLQALRKSGELRYDRVGGWTLAIGGAT